MPNSSRKPRVQKPCRKAAVATAPRAPKLPYKIAMVSWVDAVTEDDWQDLETAKLGMTGDWLVHSAGFLVKDDEEGIVLAGSVSDDEGVSRTLLVKRANIKDIKIGKAAKGVTTVSWNDAISHEDWHAASDTRVDQYKKSIVHSAGILLAQSKEGVVMSVSKGRGDMVSQVIKIPHGMINSIKP